MDVSQQIYCLRQEADSPRVPVKAPGQMHEVAHSFWAWSSTAGLKKKKPPQNEKKPSSTLSSCSVDSQNVFRVRSLTSLGCRKTSMEKGNHIHNHSCGYPAAPSNGKRLTGGAAAEKVLLKPGQQISQRFQKGNAPGSEMAAWGGSLGWWARGQSRWSTPSCGTGSEREIVPRQKVLVPNVKACDRFDIISWAKVALTVTVGPVTERKRSHKLSREISRWPQSPEPTSLQWRPGQLSSSETSVKLSTITLQF